MWRYFCALFKKDCRMLASGKFFLISIGFLALYTAYVNLGYVRFMDMSPYNVYLYDPAGTQRSVSTLVQIVSSIEALDAALQADTSGVGLDASAGEVQVVLYTEAEHIDRHRADYALSMLRPSDSRPPNHYSRYNRVAVPGCAACVPPGNGKGGMRLERYPIPTEKRFER